MVPRAKTAALPFMRCEDEADSTVVGYLDFLTHNLLFNRLERTASGRC